jgi:hypothetical protein
MGRPQANMRRRHETEFYARQASILLGNNACRSGNDRSPTLKVFFALSRGRRGTQRALNSVSCLLLYKGIKSDMEVSPSLSAPKLQDLRGPPQSWALLTRRTLGARFLVTPETSRAKRCTGSCEGNARSPCDLYRPERRTGERMAIPGSLSLLAQKHGSKRFKNRLAA